MNSPQTFTGATIIIAIKVVEVQDRPSSEMVEALGVCVGAEVPTVSVVHFSGYPNTYQPEQYDRQQHQDDSNLN